MDFIIPIVTGASIAAAGIVIAPTVKFAINIAPFLYANTKCSAKSGTLLQKKFYDEMVSASFVKELYTLLEDSSYSYLTEHANDFNSLSKGLTKDLYDTYVWMLKSMPTEIVPIIKALKLKFEIEDLKRAINNIKSGKAAGELDYIEDETLKLKLEDVKDMDSFASIMENTIYADVFASSSSDIAKINMELDRFYHLYVMKAMDRVDDDKITGAFKDYWRNMIDIINVKLILRKIRSKKEDAGMIPGGYLDMKDLAGVNEINQLESVLANSIYSEHITEINDFGIELGMFKFLREEAGSIGAKHTLRSGSVVKYILLKELEVRNLNIIFKLKEEGFKAEEIQKLMVV